jgi:DNA replication protein DnaC
MLISSDRIQYDSLSDAEFDIVVRDNPAMGGGPYEYCPTCRKQGTFRYRGIEHVCDCQEQWNLHMKYLSAGIGVLYQRLDWDHYTGDPEVVRSLQAYVRNHDGYIEQGLGLLFTGARGVGKTMLATLVLKEFIRAGYSCCYTTYSSAMEMYTAGWRDHNDKRRFEDKFLRTKVLLLDDMGREAKSSNNMQESTFEHIVRNRVQSCRPTILTTNLNYGDLEESYGEATMSLLTEQSMVVEMTGDSFRPKSNARKFDEPESGERRPIF